MDDETYVKFDFKTLPGAQYSTKTTDEVLAESYISIPVEKFGAKVLVWQAICQCGKKTTPFVSTGTINTDIYVKECLTK